MISDINVNLYSNKPIYYKVQLDFRYPFNLIRLNSRILINVIRLISSWFHPITAFSKLSNIKIIGECLVG